MLSSFPDLSMSDKIAAVGVGVAVLAISASFVPAVIQIIVAQSSARADNQAREPALNASILMPDGWPVGYTLLNLSIGNKSDYFIEVKRVRLVAPRRLLFGLCPFEAVDNPGPAITVPDDPLSVPLSREASTGNTLVKPVGSTRFRPGLNDPRVGAVVPDDSLDLYFVLFAPERNRRAVRVTLKVDVARANRQTSPSVLPVYLDVPAMAWSQRSLG